MLFLRRSFLRTPFFPCWVLCIVGACAATPTPVTPPPAPVSETNEIQMGRDIDRSLLAAHRFYNDSVLGRYVQEFGVRLAAKSERPGLPWTFRILDDPGLNAFAFPGGIVYVTRGILAYLNSEAQLAGVLGHEIGHVAAGHAVDRSTRLGITGAGLVVGTAGGAMTPVSGSLDRLQALLLAHSRQAEQEADSLGLRYMSEAGYDPMEMVGVLRTIEGSAGGPAWLASHPSPENRVEEARVVLSTLQNPGTRIERDAYLAHLEGLVVGLDRREGYVAGSRVIVPTGGYQFTFPAGWALSRDGTAVRAVSPGNHATVELTTTEQSSADSAASYFFAKVGKARGALVHDQVNGFPAVSGSFSALPVSIKIGGSVRLIEFRGAVYRVMGYTKDDLWPQYREVLDSALGTFDQATEADVERAQPFRIAIVPLQRAMSITTLGKARPAPLTPAELAGLNQVEPDSVLPAGHSVKWVVGPALH